jgi:thermitase
MRLRLLFPALLCLCLFPAAAAAHSPQKHSPLSSSSRTRLIVKFDAQASAAVRRATLARVGARPVRGLKHLHTLVISVPRAQAPAAVKALAHSDAVTYAERDGVVTAALAPNDTYYNGSVNPCTASLGCWPYQNADLPAAWDVTTGSSTVTVAVIDTGVASSHPDLSGAVLTGYNFVAGNTNTEDDQGHGTEVAGVIAARFNNGAGVPGVCGQCKILPVKVLDSTGHGSTSNIAQGITWAADHGARVINLSLASTTADTAMKDAINYAVSHGVLVVAAAGNAGSTDPAACNGGSCGGYPAAFTSQISTGLLAVGATDYFNALYSFSNHGSWVSVAAPGCAISSTMDGSYASSGVCGTSIASPFVAGVAALAFSYAPTLTVAQAQSAITSSVSHPSGLDVAYGQVDAYAMLQSLGYTPPPVAPTNSALPQVTGGTSPTVGDTVSASTGTWSGTPTPSYSYQWQSSTTASSGFTNISGAAASSYTIATAQSGKYLRVVVTATNTGGTLSANSAATGQVAAAPVAPTNSVAPTVSGTPRVNDTLAAAKGTWSGTPTPSYSYQWQSSTTGTSGWTDVSGAASVTYTALSPDLGKYLRVRVTATNSGGSLAAYSPATGQVAAALVSAPANSVLPTLSGNPTVGDTLNVSTGTWSGTPSYSYQWQSSANGTSWVDVAGATAPAYTVTSVQVGKYLRAVVTATNSGGAVSASSLASGQVSSGVSGGSGGGGSGGGSGGGGGGGGSGPPADVNVSLSSDQPLAIKGGQLIWRVNVGDKVGVAGASGVRVTIEIPMGLTVLQTSADRGPGCGPVEAGRLVCNVDSVNSTLIAHIIVWTSVDQDGDFTLRASVSHDRTDATPADDSAVLVVKSSTPPAQPANPKVAPKAVPKVTAKVTLTGTAAVGKSLTARPSGATALSYQWQLCRAGVCRDVKGATHQTLTVKTAFVGGQLRVRVGFSSLKLISALSHTVKP